MKKPTIEQVKGWIEKAGNEWLAENMADEATVRAVVHNRLVADVSDMLTTLMGMSKRYGFWEIESVNHHLSPLQVEIGVRVREAASKWAAEHLNGPLDVSKSVEKRILKAYQDAYAQELFCRATAQGVEDARRVATEFWGRDSF